MVELLDMMELSTAQIEKLQNNRFSPLLAALIYSSAMLKQAEQASISLGKATLSSISATVSARLIDGSLKIELTGLAREELLTITTSLQEALLTELFSQTCDASET